LKELAIISGKGGTGKTSLSAAFAALLGEVVLVDADVDASNLHLLMDPRRKEEHAFICGRRAVILHDQCKLCGACVESCPFGAMSLKGNKVQISSACEGCGLCREVCHFDAVSYLPAHQGDWFVSDTRFGPMVHARLEPGADNSGRLVSVVRRRARTLAESLGISRIIVDGPPGVGCPAIATITGCDGVVVVTEATVSGENDAIRALELVGHFNLPAVLVINRCEVNPEATRRLMTWAERQGIVVAGTLKSHDGFVRSQRQRLTVLEGDDEELIQQIRAIYGQVESTLFGSESAHPVLKPFLSQET